MYNKAIIGGGFCDIQNNQGQGKCYQSKPKASTDNTYWEVGVRSMQPAPSAGKFPSKIPWVGLALLLIG